MNLFFSGNPLNMKDDIEAIYTLPNFLPPRHELDIKFSIEKKDINSFIENLYLITMEENGFCYFYPNIEKFDNLCRFEWHYDFRGKLYFLRIGLFFRINNSRLKDICCSIQQHEKYIDPKKEIVDCNITEKELAEIESFIYSKIEKAKKRIISKRDKVFNNIYYIKTNRPIKDLTYLNTKNILLMPTYSLNSELITSIILPINAFSFFDSNRFGKEKIHLFCAFYSLAVGSIKLESENKLPSISPISIDNKEKYLKNIGSFYPDCQTELFGLKYLESGDFNMLDWLYKAFNKIDSNNIKKVTNIIFAYYAGQEATKNNKTLALVSYVSCMSSISKIFESEYSKENGDRKTIVYYLSHKLNIESDSIEYKDLDKWSKKIYNDHRSSYVHGSSHKFEEYSQNLDGNNFAGLPNAIPSQDRVVSKQYEYNNDFNIVLEVVKFMIIRCFQDLSEIKFDDINKYETINFSIKSTSEGYLGMPNKGWLRAT